MNVTDRTVDQYEAMFSRWEATKMAELHENAEHTADIRTAVAALERAEEQQRRRNYIRRFVFRVVCAAAAAGTELAIMRQFVIGDFVFAAAMGFAIGFLFTLPLRFRN